MEMNAAPSRSPRQSSADNLLKGVPDLVAHFLALPPADRHRAEAIKPLICLFNKLSKARNNLTEGPESKEPRNELSRGMLTLNNTLLRETNDEPRQRLKSLYNLSKVVEGQADLLEENTFRQRFLEAMLEACDIGLGLHADPVFQQYLLEERNRKTDFLMRVDKVCCALVEHCSTRDQKAEIIIRKASEYLDSRRKDAQQEADASSLLSGVSSSLSCDPPDVKQCISSATSFSALFLSGSPALRSVVKHQALRTFKEVQEKRKGANITDELKQQLTRVMLALNAALNLGTALMRQINRNDEAIHVFESILLQCQAPQARIRPLIALRQLYTLAKDANRVAGITRDLREACLQAEEHGKRYTAILELPDNQQLALFDMDSMAEYIRQCQNSLSRGEALSLLKELPAMVTATRLLWPECHDDPVLLSLLGQADLQVGDTDAALKRFQRVTSIDRSPKNQGITWLLIGNTYVAQGKMEEAVRAYERSFDATKQEVAPLLKAATACRLMGDFDRAMFYLDRIEASCLDAKPAVTKTVRAKTLWGRSQITGGVKDVRSACQIVQGLILDSRPTDQVAIRCLIDMLRHPIAQSLLSDVIRTTNEFSVIESIRASLPNQSDIPQVVLEAVLSRLEDSQTTTRLGRFLVGIMVQALVRSYFSGAVGEMSFDALADRVFSCFLAQVPDRRREWMKELLIAERGTVLREIVRGYSEAATEVLAPLFNVTKGNESMCYNPEIMQNLNAFLLTDFPSRLLPTEYGDMDSIDLRQELVQVMDVRRSELQESIDGGCNILVQNFPPLPVLVSWRYWMLAKPFLVELLMMVEGPLKELATESIWTLDVSLDATILHVTVTFDRIDPVRHPSEIMARTDSALRAWQQRGSASMTVDLPADCSWHDTRKLCIKARIVTPNEEQVLLGRMTICTTYLLEETQRILDGGAADPAFVRKVDELFPHENDAAFKMSSREWGSLLRYVFDREVRCAIDWLITHHPNGHLHTLKNRIRLLRARMTDGGTVTESEVKELQQHAIEVIGKLGHVLKTEMLRYRPPVIDGGSCVLRSIAQANVSHAVQMKTEISPSIYVAMHPWQLDSVVQNLVANAVRAASRSGIEVPWVHVLVSRLVADDAGKRWMLLNVDNPFSQPEALDPESTGIGLKTVKHIVEVLNGGLLHIWSHIEDNGVNVHSVTVRLPLIGDE